VDINQFTQFLIQQITEGIKNSPPKPISVKRVNGTLQQTSLPQLIAELSDQMIIANTLKREELLRQNELIQTLKENTKIGKKSTEIAKRMLKRKRSDEEDDFDEDDE
jgi:hypothetical protein